jgi:hypothetical protein
MRYVLSTIAIVMALFALSPQAKADPLYGYNDHRSFRQFHPRRYWHDHMAGYRYNHYRHYRHY